MAAKDLVRKPVSATIRLTVPAGAARPAPPVGPALGQYRLNLMAFCKDFNARTQKYKPDTPMGVTITAYKDNTFDFTVKSPSVTWYLKKAAGIDLGSSRPGHLTASTVTLKHIYEIAKVKQSDPNCLHIPLESIYTTGIKMGTRVFVGGLTYRVRERDIEKFFRKYGRIKEVAMKNGFAFVEFDDYRDADDAVYELNGKELLGERVSVERARGTPRGCDQWRGSGGGRGYGPPRGRSRDNREPDMRSHDRYGPPTRTEYRLIVENLSSRVSWQDLKDYMRQAGEVTYADAHKQRRNEGVVEFASYSDMKNAIDKLDDTELNGRRIRLIEDRRRGSRRSRSSSSRSRSRSRSRRRSRSRSSRSRSHRSSRSKSRDRSKSKSAAHSKSRSRSKSKEVSKSRSRSRSHSKRSKSRSCSKENGAKNRSHSRSLSKEGSKSRSQSPTKENSPEKHD